MVQNVLGEGVLVVENKIQCQLNNMHVTHQLCKGKSAMSMRNSPLYYNLGKYLSSFVLSSMAPYENETIPARQMDVRDELDSAEPDERDVGDLELRGLLSGVQSVGKTEVNSSERVHGKGSHVLYEWLDEGAPWSRRRMAGVALVLILLILGATLAPPYLGFRRKPHPNSTFVGTELRSNGTDDFRRTVLIVSIDGLRYVCW